MGTGENNTRKATSAMPEADRHMPGLQADGPWGAGEFTQPAKPPVAPRRDESPQPKRPLPGADEHEDHDLFGNRPTPKGPLSGTWQTSAGARFHIDDDGTTLTTSLVESSKLREFAGVLTRRGVAPNSKSFTGTVETVFRPLAAKHYSVRVTATLDDSGQLHLCCTDWPTWNNRGKYLGTRPLREIWTRQPQPLPAARWVGAVLELAADPATLKAQGNSVRRSGCA
jgi:hypothetical protein